MSDKRDLDMVAAFAEALDAMERRLLDKLATKGELVSLREAMHATLASKGDLVSLREEMRATLATKGELVSLREEMRATLATKGELGALREEMREGFASLQRGNTAILDLLDTARGDVLRVLDARRLEDMKQVEQRLQGVEAEVAKLKRFIG